jgi:hypothetical protein
MIHHTPSLLLVLINWTQQIDFGALDTSKLQSIALETKLEVHG